MAHGRPGHPDARFASPLGAATGRGRLPGLTSSAKLGLPLASSVAGVVGFLLLRRMPLVVPDRLDAESADEAYA